MKSLVVIFTAVVVMFTTSISADEIKKEDVIMDCKHFGEEAAGIQMIRQEGETLEHIVLNFGGMLADNLPPEENNRANIFILMTQIKAVGEWVYAQYPQDWEPNMVGTTYTQECLDKTMTQLRFAKKQENDRSSQAKKAWQANQ